MTARTIRTWEAGEVPTYAINRVGGLSLLWQETAADRHRYSRMNNAALLAEAMLLLSIVNQRLAGEDVRSPELPEPIDHDPVTNAMGREQTPHNAGDTSPVSGDPEAGWGPLS